jgi:serralysin
MLNDQTSFATGISGVEQKSATRATMVPVSSLDIDPVAPSSQADVLGTPGDDTLTGTPNDDFLTGYGGNNSLNGLGGSDYAVYQTAPGGIVVNLTSGTASANGYGGTDTLSSIENVLGSGSADNVTGDGNPNSMAGNGGDDQLFGMGANDTLYGNDGNDTLDGGAGRDLMIGGTGDDVYVLDDVLDTITEQPGEGTDRIEFAKSVTYTLPANVEDGLARTGITVFLTGNALVNHLTGAGGDDRLDGGAGADVMNGGAGNDTYWVDNAGDQIIDSSGTDLVNTTLAAYTLQAGLENLTFTDSGPHSGTGNAANNIITGGSGDDVLTGLDGNDTLDGGAGNNRLIGGAGSNNLLNGTADYSSAPGPIAVHYRTAFTDAGMNGWGGTDSFFHINGVIGTAFNDVIEGAGGADRLEGGGGNDTLIGTEGGDTLLGGTGDDIYMVSTSPGAINIGGFAGFTVVELPGEGTDSFVGSTGGVLPANVENWLDFTFQATGNELDNLLRGTSGDQTFIGLGGNNTYIGGGGVDTVDYTAAPAGVHVDLNEGRATANGYGGTDIVTAISNVRGTGFDDVIVGSAGANRLEGGAGHDVLAGLGGDDVLVGGSGAANEMVGGTGNDTYIVSAVGDTIYEAAGEGNDTVQTAFNSFTLGANVENLIFTGTGDFTGIGGSTDNMILGGAGNDRLSGMGGNNVLDGGVGGNDTADYSAATGNVSVGLGGGSGNNGFGGTDQLLNIENIIGGNGDDVLVGDGGNNLLAGGAGRDVLIGGAGNDILVGGAGAANELYGGAGDDVYSVSAGDTIVENAGEGTDTVETNLSFIALGANIETLVYTGSGNFGALANASDNTIRGGSGNDSIDGAAGNDVYLLSGLQGEYTFEEQANGSWLVTDHAPDLNGNDGADLLTNVERVRFKDGTERALVHGVGSAAHSDAIAPAAAADAAPASSGATVAPTAFATGDGADHGLHPMPDFSALTPVILHGGVDHI